MSNGFRDSEGRDWVALRWPMRERGALFASAKRPEPPLRRAPHYTRAIDSSERFAITRFASANKL